MLKRGGFPTPWSCDIRRLDIAVRKNWESHIDASHSRQPLVKGERLVRYEMNAVILNDTVEANMFVCGPDALPTCRPVTHEHLMYHSCG